MTPPVMPKDLDDALYNALRVILGDALAFPAVDAVWDVICEHKALHARPLNGLLGYDLGALTHE